MNAALGGVSAGGLGAPLFEVTHSGDGPNAFVASHPAGKAGGVTLSKFSFIVARPPHGPHLPRRGRIPAIVGPIAIPTAMMNSNKTNFRSPVDVSTRFGFSILVMGSGAVVALAGTLVSGKAWVYTTGKSDTN